LFEKIGGLLMHPSERPVQCYSEVFRLGAKGQGFVVEVDFY